MAAADNFRRRHDLSCVALRVLGRMKNQPEDVGGQFLASNRARLQQVAFRCVGDLLQGTMHGRSPCGDELFHRRPRRIEMLLRL